MITDRFARDQLPRTRLEAEHLVGQRADRTDIDDIAAEFAVDRLADISTDLEHFAAAHAAQFGAAGDFGHEAYATRALDAARHVCGDERTEILVRHDAFALGEARDRAAVAHRQILQLALAALVADRAVERMIDQQEFHDVALRRQCALRLRVDFHAFHDRRGTGRLRLRHRLAAHLGLDHAHAAIGRDRQLVVVAETRDRNAGLVGGRDDHRVLRHLQRLAVDLDVDQVRRRGPGARLRAHAVPLSPSSSRRTPGSSAFVCSGAERQGTGFRLSPE